MSALGTKPPKRTLAGMSAYGEQFGKSFSLYRYHFMMTNEEATIANIRAQLVARGWTTINEEITDNPYKPENNCHLELFHEDGTRKGWGMFPRIYCWTEAFEAITGQPWLNSVVKGDMPSP